MTDGRAISTIAGVTDAVEPVHTALGQGRLEDATAILGHYWSIEAVVEHGDARGRTFGFPTANMHLLPDCPLAFGVYAVRVGILGEKGLRVLHKSVANYGIRPMYRISQPLLEAHLLDFDGDLYGKVLKVEFVAYLRPEAKFSNIKALIAQISADAQQARGLLG